MLTNDTAAGPKVMLDASFVRDAHTLRAEAKRLRDFFLSEAARIGEPGVITRVSTLTFNYENLTSIATMLHQLATLDRPKQD